MSAGRIIGRRRLVGATLAGGAAAAWHLPLLAQPRLPVVGFLRSTPAEPFLHLARAFREGLAEAGYVEGRNVAIEYRFADNDTARLPALASGLIERGVDVIVGNSQAAEAAKAATRTIPIVFVTGDDPVTRGLVDNLARPGGNATGMTFFGGGLLGAKRLELLHELVPGAATVAVLADPSWPGTAAELAQVETAARALGLTLVALHASRTAELEPVFRTMTGRGAAALIVCGAPFFTSQRAMLVALAARHALPAIYDLRDHVAAGGLISYAASLAGAYRQAGLYAGRILDGAKPAELPVLQPSTFELVLNLRTARALGLAIPEALFARADEVIE